jgi:hypothetical protein
VDRHHRDDVGRHVVLLTSLGGSFGRGPWGRGGYFSIESCNVGNNIPRPLLLKAREESVLCPLIPTCVSFSLDRGEMGCPSARPKAVSGRCSAMRGFPSEIRWECLSHLP